jgi:threonine/homoserine/homoserine lactone efflux protein
MSLALFALLLQGAALGVSAAASPGPMQTFLISETLIGGFKRSFPIAFAPLATDLPIVVLILVVLKQLPPGATRLLSLVGGLYVLYLAWGLWRQWRAGAGRQFEAAVDMAGPWAILRRAVVMNFLNPNPYLFWGLVGGPILLGALEQSALHAGAFLIGMYGVFIGLQIGMIAVFHYARRLGARIVRGMLLVSIGVLALFGGVLVVRGVTG